MTRLIQILQVAVRVRCLNQREKDAETGTFWKTDGPDTIVTREDKPSDKRYVYDRVFSPDEDNMAVYEGKH